MAGAPKAPFAVFHHFGKMLEAFIWEMTLIGRIPQKIRLDQNPGNVLSDLNHMFFEKRSPGLTRMNFAGKVTTVAKVGALPVATFEGTQYYVEAGFETMGLFPMDSIGFQKKTDSRVPDDL